MKLINTQVPEKWSMVWIGMWVVVTAVLIAAAFTVSVPWFLGAFFVLFFIPELISLKKGDSLPPLTQTVRHFLPVWLAFPLLYGLLGAYGAKALGYGRWWAVGVLFGLLGWLTEHFTFTYMEEDPWPGQELVTPQTSSRRRLKL